MATVTTPARTSPTEPPASPRGRRRPRSAARMRESLSAWTMLAPNLSLVTVFLLVPLVMALVLSFQYSTGLTSPSWAGLANYRQLLDDPVFWRTVANTAVFCLATVPIEMAMGLGLALLFNSVMPARPVWRTLVYLPMVISGVATALIGTLMFDENIGLLNKLIGAVGIDSLPWQTDGAAAMGSVILITLWMRVGFNMVIYLAGLQGISPELYEAARVEGASYWQQLRNITVPMLGPSTFFLLIMNVIYSFQVFDTVFVMTLGGPGHATDVMITYAYRNGFEGRQQGYAAAIGIVLYLLVMAFTALQWRFSRNRDTVG
ncbi:Lactose transport system permease protein LacF [Streptomyces sp. YIM 130001]|uniref:carbohydrate ABC transporter permease n=1 Tax=Streptomyces sp. YIM 130001 TaxID=2259644 RepID=UPI000E64A427|nr:sugar ABC transporter permease [Streptomyces sp. YIM 130001]RII15625.1 Lactose transport system permease protein LacF [Streptomyces sp. YIM 130001]